MEVKKEEEHDEGTETQAEGKGKMGKGLPDVKMEEKPEVRLSTLLKMCLKRLNIFEVTNLNSSLTGFDYS